MNADLLASIQKGKGLKSKLHWYDSPTQDLRG